MSCSAGEDEFSDDGSLDPELAPTSATLAEEWSCLDAPTFLSVIPDGPGAAVGDVDDGGIG
jgi:hypothetical protein